MVRVGQDLAKLSVTTVRTTAVGPFVGVVTPYDVSGGGLTVVLPALSSLVVGDVFVVRKVDSSGNVLKVQGASGDRFADASTSFVELSGAGQQVVLRVRAVSGRLFWANETGVDAVGAGADASEIGAAPVGEGSASTVQGILEELAQAIAGLDERLSFLEP